jgi:hypothetical protein
MLDSAKKKKTKGSYLIYSKTKINRVQRIRGQYDAMFHQVENINKCTEIMKLSQKEFGE